MGINKKVVFLWRGIVIVARDIFTGFLMGVSAALLLLKVNPGLSRGVALLIPAGIAAGLLKGLAKFVFLNFSGALPSTGYRLNYPKFKILGLWLAIFFGILTFSYGLNIGKWAGELVTILRENYFLGTVDTRIWIVLFSFISITGLLANFYEPPVDLEEALPEPEPEEEQDEIGAG